MNSNDLFPPWRTSPACTMNEDFSGRDRHRRNGIRQTDRALRPPLAHLAAVLPPREVSENLVCTWFGRTQIICQLLLAYALLFSFVPKLLHGDRTAR